MQYQYRTMHGSGSSPRTEVKAPLKNAIIAVLCIIALIAVAFIFPASSANADNPDTSTPSPSVFPMMPPSYCGDGTVTVLSGTGEVYLVGIGKNSIARGRENNAGSDGNKEVGAKCMIPGPFLPAARAANGNSKMPDSTAHNEKQGRYATYEALGSDKDGTLWAVLNQSNDTSDNPAQRFIAIYRAKPGENNNQWTQMGGVVGYRNSTPSGYPTSTPLGYWGYSKRQLTGLGYVVGGGVNSTNGRYYFMSTEHTGNRHNYTNIVHIWATPEGCSQTSCLPTEVKKVTVGETDSSISGGDLTFDKDGNLILTTTFARPVKSEGKAHYQEFVSDTGIISANVLSQGGSMTLTNEIRSVSKTYETLQGYEPAQVTGIGLSYNKDGSSFPVATRFSTSDHNKNNIYDFSGYQMKGDSNSAEMQESIVYAFPPGPAYRSDQDLGSMKIGHVIEPDPAHPIWIDENGNPKYSRTSIPTLWNTEFTDIADGVYVPPTGSLTINKVDKDDNSQKLSKARFAVWRQAEASCDVDIKNLPADAKTTGPTGTDGQVKVNDLAYGTYCVKETTAPDNHKLNDKAQVANISAATPNVILTFEDELVSTITVKKIDESSHDALEGATFVLYVDANNDGKVDSGDTKYPNNDSATKKTDSNGLAEWTDIPVGHYILQETKAPEGYVTPSGEQANHPVEVTKDNAKKGVTLTITNFTFTAQLPLTGGTSTDVFVISSVALIVIAGGLYGLYMVYRRRQSLH